MNELNNNTGTMVTDEDGFDTTTITDMGEAFSIAQVTEAGDLEDVVLGVEQVRALVIMAERFLSRHAVPETLN